MKIMVCVTTQRECDRLIRAGQKLMKSPSDHMILVHIAHYELTDLGHSKEGDALEYLYTTAFEYGVNLMVIRSNDVSRTLIDQIKEMDIDNVVLGASKAGFRGENVEAAIGLEFGEDVDVHVIP